MSFVKHKTTESELCVPYEFFFAFARVYSNTSESFVLLTVDENEFNYCERR